jgi:hypothetical protein
MVQIDDDVQGVADALHGIDSHISLRFSEAGNYFVIQWKDDHESYLITTAQDLDQRIVKRVEKIYHDVRQPGYSFAGELEKAEAKNKAEMDHEASEARGPALERLAHAMRADLGYDKQRVFIPEKSTG